MKQVKVEWGARTVAKGAACGTDVEALRGGVALSLVGTKGVAPWRVEIPIDVLRRCLAQWAQQEAGAVAIGAAMVLDGERVTRLETMTAKRAMAFVRLVRNWQALIEADWPNARVEAEESLARWLADADGDGEIERVRALRRGLGLEADATMLAATAHRVRE